MSWFKDWTVIAVVHRLNTIMNFDRVAVIASGKLVEYGRPQQLLGRDSAFKSLYELSVQSNT